MRRCPACGANGLERRTVDCDPETPWFNCPHCKNEILIPDHVLNDPLEGRHEDIGIAGWWPGLDAFKQMPEAYANEVTDLGGESIFGASAFERRCLVNAQCALSH